MKKLRLGSFLKWFFSVFLYFISIPAWSQPPIQWQRTLGGTNDDNATSIRATNDGGYITIGSTISNNGDVAVNNGFVDYWVAKLDASGNIQWQKALGGSKSDVGYTIEQTVDGGYILAGYADSNDGQVTDNHGYTDFWVIKLDASGNIKWQKALGGSYHDNARSVVQTSDGGYIVTGDASSTDGQVVGNHGSVDGWVVKLDANGNISWTKCYGGSGIDEIDDIKPLPDGGFVMTGYSLSSFGGSSINHGGGDLWVIRIDALGNLLWQYTYGGTEVDGGKQVQLTPDGGFLVAGITKSGDGDVSGHHGDFDAWLIKIDNNGKLLWQKCYGGSSLDMATCLFATSGNDYIIGAQSSSSNGEVTGNHGNTDYWLIAINANGAIQWQKSYGGSGAELIGQIVPTSDGWYIATGSTRSQNGDVSGLHGSSFDFWVVKFGPDPKCVPTLNINVNQNNICMGTPVNFTAAVTNGGTNLVFQWKQNNVVVGTNSATYIPLSVREGDIISCAYRSTTPCGRDTTIISNSITMQVINDVVPEVTIAASNTEICEGTAVSFTSTSFHGQMTPTYQWLINGNPAGNNNTTFSSALFKGSTQVQCIMTIATPSCQGTTKDYSNIIEVIASPIKAPAVTITTDAINSCKGGSVTFNANGNGGAGTTYKWQINGVVQTSVEPVFITKNLKDGDVVSCMIEVAPGAQCFTANTAMSNEITVRVTDAPTPIVSITASDLDVCAGTEVTFTALPENTGSTKMYQWQLNGQNVGDNLPVYTNSKLSKGDKVSCLLTTDNPNCPATAVVVSNVETINVRDVPQINFSPTELTIMKGQQVQLKASVKGNIASFEWKPSNALVDPLTLTPLTKAITEETVYQLILTDVNGCAAIKKVIVKVFNKLYIPSAFTPNGDGVNDIFRIPPGTFIKLKQFSVYDRWGNKIFTTIDKSKGWDGNFKGRLIDAGTYVYYLQGIDNNGEVLLKGTVLLVR